jgi:DNA-binding MarR family transcriptional regulator
MSEQDRDAVIDELLHGYERVMTRLADVNAPEFLEIDVTMAQAKLLYLLAAYGDLRMSDLVGRLRVSLPTVSGLVDRVVAHGFAARHEDPLDRRHVVVSLTPAGAGLIDRFRELNAREMRDLLEVLDDADLAEVRSFLGVLERGIARLAAAGKYGPIPAAEDPGR